MTRGTSVLLPLLGLLACDDGPTCPDHSNEPSTFIPSGTYAELRTCEPEFCEFDFSPREGATDFSLEVDRAANLVWIRFTRDGVAVEERWRIVSREIDQ
jgi:hypothetical protein